MTKQSINTENVASATNKLRNANTNIDNAFNTAKIRAKQLENNWRGKASTAAQTTLEQIFKSSAARSSVIANYIRMLEQQVNPGYVNTEDVNTKLADKFK